MSFRFNHSGNPDSSSEYELSDGQSLDLNAGDSLKLADPDDIADMIPQGHDVLVLTKDGSSYLLKNFLLADGTELELPDGTSITANDFKVQHGDAGDSSEKLELRGVSLEQDDSSGSIAVQSVTILSIISALSQNTSAFNEFAIREDGSENATLRNLFVPAKLSLLGDLTEQSEYSRLAEQTAADSQASEHSTSGTGGERSETKTSATQSKGAEDPGNSIAIDVTDTLEPSTILDLTRVRVSATVLNAEGEEISSETVVDEGKGTVEVIIEVNEDNAGEQVDVQVVVTDPSEGGKVIDRSELEVVLPNPFNEENVALTLSNSDILENIEGANIGSLLAFGTGKDIEGPFTYSIVGDRSNLFEIEGSSLKLRDGSSIDFETAPEDYQVTVRIADSDGTQIDRTLTLTPTDANDAPELAESSLTGSEDATITFDRETFEQAFSDVDGDDTLASVRIESLPANGTLALDGLALAAGQTISIDQIGSVSFQPSPDWNGHTDFNWSGFDGTDWSAQSTTISIDIESINDAPVTTFSIGAQTANEDAAFSFEIPKGLFSDADTGDSLNVSAVHPSWLTFDATTGTFSGVPSYENVGSHKVTVTATDSEGKSVASSFDLNVDNINDRPSFTQIQDVSIGEYDSIEIDAGSHFSDEDSGFGDSLRFAATLADGTELPEWLSIDENTGRITGTPPEGQDTNLDIRVTATDENDASVSSTFSFHVSNQNDAPELVSEINDATTSEDAPFSFDVSGSFGDSDLADTLSYSAKLPDGTEIPDWLIFDTATGVFSGTPENDDVGMLAITVTASDGQKSTSDTFAIMVQNTNDGPVALGIANETATEDQGFSLDISDSFTDSDLGDELTYSATQTNGMELPDWLSFDESTGEFSGTPENEDVGELSIIVVASDGEENANAIFSIEVENTNDGPVATFIPEQNATEGLEFLFDASSAFSDIDEGDELTYSATLENGDPLPDWISINQFTGEISGTPENANVGKLSLAVTASDGEASASANLSIEIENTNDGPVVSSSISDQSLNEDEAFTLDIASNFSDADLGDALTYAATLDNGDPLPEWISFDAETGQFSGTPTNSEVGQITIKVIASDGEATAETSFKIEVDNENDAPVVWTYLDDQSLREDSIFSLDVSSNFGDVDFFDELTFTATLENGDPLPSWLNFDSQTGEFSGTPLNDDLGSLSITVTASDGQQSASDTFSIAVENTNDGPVAIADIEDQTISEDNEFTLETIGNFDDADLSDVLTFSATLADGSELPTWLTIDTETGTLSGTPENGDVGELKVKVIASDGEASTASQFRITIENTNDSPTVTAAVPEQTIDEDSPFSLDLSNNFDEHDSGDALTYSATLENGDPLPSWLSLNPISGLLSGTPENDDTGNLTLKIVASDGESSTSLDVSVNVENTNDQPVVTAEILDQTIMEDSEFSMDVSSNFGDADFFDELTFYAKLEDGSPLPEWLSIDPATGIISGTPGNEDVGDLNIRVSASDGTSTATDTFRINIENTNDGPVVTTDIEDQSISEDEEFTLETIGNFDDSDLGDVLTFSATLADGSPLPEWLTIDPETGTLSGTPTNDAVGEIDVKVTASDGESSASSNFKIEVANTNDQPLVISAISEQSTGQGSEFALDVSKNFEDADLGSELTYSAKLADGSPLPDWITLDPETGKFSGTPQNGDEGILNLIVTASDGSSSAETSFSITVENINDAPTVTESIESQTAGEDAAFSLDVSGKFADVDAGDILSYSATLQDGSPLPSWLSFDEESATFSGTPENGDVGEISITVTATDGEEVAESTFSIQVTNTNDGPVATTIEDQASQEDSEFNFNVSGNFSDIDAGDELSFEAALPDGSPLPAWLAFDKTTGQFSGTPDTYNVGTLNIKVTASDGEQTAEQTFSISVAKTNDLITAVVDTDSDTNTIAENATEGTTVGIVASAADADVDDSITYAVNDSRFTVDSDGTLKVASGASFNAETESSIDIVVTATSTDGSTSNETFTIAVSDIDEADVSATTDTDTDANTIAENATEGSTVGITASATDTDATNSDVIYSVNDARFTVDANGVVKVGADASFDTETEPSIDIVVTSTSQDGSTSNETFSIAVSDIDEADVSATTDIDTDANTIAENATEGTTVGITARATDADATNSDVSYSVNDARFTVDENGVVKVAAGAYLDTETEPTIDIVVTSTSQDGSTSNETFSIAVSDIDEVDVSATTDTDTDANTIAENATEGTTVGITANATDTDATNSVVTYAVNDARFTVDANGVVKVAADSSFDTETEPSIDIVVTSTSQDGSTSNETFTIAVSDIDEADVSATTDTDTDTNTIAENATEETTVGITASATDSDATNNEVSYSVDDARFTVDANGVVKVASGASFDTETEPSIDIVVTSTSQDGSTSNETFSIAVSDIDEANVSATTDTDTDANTIAENATEGTTVGITANATDSDATNSDVTYSVDDARFTVDAYGDVKVAAGASFDTETEPSIDIVITSTSQDGSTSNETFTIAVNDVDEEDVSAVADTNAGADTIDEDAFNGDTVGIVAFASDADATNNTVTYSLSDDANGAFRIDGSTGLVTVADATKIDYETATSKTIEVTATSADGSTSTQSYSIAITDDNEFDVSPVTDTNDAVNQLNENASEGISVGIVASATDADGSNNTVSYSVDDDRFTVDPDGTVRVASGASFDAETETSIDIVVTATSADGSTSQETFSLDVNDIDEFDISSISDEDAGANSVAESASNGDTVGINALASDDDATVSSVTYSLSDDADGAFTIDPSTGEVTVANATKIDYETATSKTIEVTATSADGSTSTQSYSIAITDEDEFDVSPAADTNEAANQLNENASEGISVGIVASATDADGANNAVSYSVDDSRFTVDPDGTVRVAEGASFDAETEGSIDIVVTATSTDGSTSNETFSIDLTDIDEADVSAVTDTDDTADAIAENATEGTAVGVVANATDADIDDTISYSVDDARFTVDPDGTVRVAEGASFDAETEGSIDILVAATSTDGSTSNETFSIDVTDIDEADVSAVTDTDDTADAIAENATEGTAVGVVASATDSDITDSVTYSVDDSRFTVDPDGTVRVASGASFDAETEGSIDIVVTATSTDGSTSNETFSIDVTDIDEADVSAVTDTDDTADAITENATEGTAVGVVANATDADITDTVSYSVDDARFTVDPDGTVRVAEGASFDAETEGSIDIVVTATSTDGSTSNETFSIDVTDIDEADVSAVTDTDDTVDAIAENATEGTAVGVIATATDSDITDSVTYSVDDSRFTVDPDGTVRVASGASFDAETEGSIDIVVTATSTDGSTSNETFSIDVTDINEAGVSAVTDTDDTADAIAENATEGTAVGVVASANDSDITDSVSYSVDDSRFTVDPDGTVRVASGASFDAETEGSIDIVVTATSADGSTSNETFSIDVTDIDEADVSAVTDTDDTADAIAENATEGTAVGVVASANDSDITDTVSYSVDDSRFTVDPDGTVRVASGASFDAETEGSIDIVVTATSTDGSTSNETFSIDVTDIDEADVSAVTDTDDTADAIAENATEGTAVGVVANATDSDITDTVSYSVDDSRFTVDPDGTVRVAEGASFDAETEGSIDIVVTATSTDGSTSNETFSINVIDINEDGVSAVTDTDDTADAIAENATEGTAVGVVANATDADITDTVSYSVDDVRFTVDPDGTVRVAEGASFDAETEGSIDIIVTATSTDGSTSNETFSIDVTDIDEADVSAVTDTDDTVDAIAENATEGTAVGIVANATDADIDDTVSYSVDDARFTVDPDGTVRVAEEASFDAETEGSIDIVVTATSTDGSTSNETFSIDVTDINEADVSAITDTDNDSDSISEFASNGDTVGITAYASDSDATNNDVSYSLSNDLSGAFDIDSLTGVVTLADASKINFETASSHTIEVTATSADGSTSVKSFNVDVVDENEAPTVTPISDQATDEDTAFSLDVSGNFSDVDEGDTLTYSATLEGGAALPAWLSIDSSTGLLSGTPENGDVGSISVTVTATDSDGAAASDTFGIQVDNTNDGPVATAISDQTTDEDSEFSLDVSGNFSDPDADDSLTFNATLENGDPLPSWISIDSQTGVLSGSPENGDAGSLSVTVTATDLDGATVAETFAIQVDQGTPDLIGQWKLDETSGTTAVDSIAGNDGTFQNGTATGNNGVLETGNAATFDGVNDYVEIAPSTEYQLNNGTFAVSFNAAEISGIQTLFSRDSHDLDNGGHIDAYIEHDGTLTVRIQSTTTSYYVSSDPGAISAGTNHHMAVSFGSNGVELFLDGNSVDTHTYTGGISGNNESIVLGTSLSSSDDGAVTNLHDYFKGSIDNFEIYDAQIDSTLAQTLYSELDTVNDAPTVDAIADQTIDEDSAFSLDTSTSFTDEDAGEVLTYTATLEGGASLPSWLSIDSTTGELSGTPENGDVGSISVTVTATDSDGASVSDTFSIQVDNTNDGPVATADAGSIAEDGTTTTGNVLSNDSDIDVGDSLSVSDITGGNVGNALAGSYGAITLNSDGSYSYAIDNTNGSVQALAAGETITDVFTYTVSDGNGGTDTATVTITINGTNDGPTVSSAIADQTTDEDAAFSLDVSGNFSDVDASDTLTYFATLSDDSPLPSWISIDSVTGELSGTPENGDVGSISVKVIASDGTTSTSDTFSIQVDNTNDGPTAVLMSGGSVDENSDGATVVATLSTQDDDAGDSHTYEIVDSNGDPVSHNLFEIVGSEVRVKSGAELDYESAQSHEIDVRSTDSSGASTTTTLELTVNDVNETPTSLSFSEHTLQDVDAAVTNSSFSISDGGGQEESIVSLDGLVTGSSQIVVGMSTVDNSFDMQVNGTAISDKSIQLQSNAFDSSTQSLLKFSDGTEFTDHWVENTNGLDRVRIIITEDSVEFWGTKTSSSTEYEQLQLEGASFNIPTLVDGDNTLSFTLLDDSGADGLTATVSATYDSVTSALTTDGQGNAVATLNENLEGATIADLSGTDPDSGDSLSFSITSNPSDLFEISGNTLKLKDGVSLDAETQASLQVTVTATDSGSNTLDKTITVETQSVNEGPSIDSTIADQSTDEDAAFSLDVSGNFSDVDQGDTLTFSATLDDGSALPNWLSIDENTGVISGTPENGNDGALNITVTASDGELTASDTFELTVADTNSTPVLVGQWKLDETSGTTAVDSAGDNDGTYENGVVLEADGAHADGTAASFDGVDDYIEISPSTDFQLDKGTFVVSFNAAQISGTQTLFSRDSNDFDGGGHLTAHIESDGTLTVRIQSDSQNYYVSSSAGAISAGTNHQMAISFGPNGLELFLDGASVATGSYAGDLTGNNEPIILGASQSTSGDGVADVLQNYFTGTIDNFEIYDNQADSSFVTDLYSTVKDPDENITGTWSDDSITTGSGNDTIDVLGGNNYVDAGDGNNTVYGGDGSDEIITGSGDDTIDSGWGEDQISSGAGDDTVTTQTINHADEYHLGDGYDSLIMESSNQHIDFTAMDTSKFSDIEEFDIGGSGSNSIRLRAEDVLDLTDENNSLFINGDSDDSVQYDSSYLSQGTETINGVDYNHLYDSTSNTHLYIDTNITDTPSF